MLIKTKDKPVQAGKVKGGAKPKINAHKRTFLTIILTMIAIIMVLLIVSLSRKTQATVYVAMSAKTLYKNEQIIDVNTQLKRYPMIQGEYEKYTVQNKNGEKTNRLITWENRDKLLGKYVATQISTEKILEYNDFVVSKVDNSNTVLYAFPGKDIVKLTLGTSDLTAFKAYLEPGDKINIECTYSEKVKFDTEQAQANATADGVTFGTARDTVETFFTTPVFKNIQIADILNSQGDSVLDLQAEYNEMSIFQQSALDADKAYQKKLEPSTLLLALTPQEKTIYYKYLAKNGATFRISLPQKAD